jgi:hypothetical protein
VGAFDEMIGGVHAILYSPAAEAVRAFLRDVLDLEGIDAGKGWLIFALPPAELAVHPAETPRHEQSRPTRWPRLDPGPPGASSRYQSRS